MKNINRKKRVGKRKKELLVLIAFAIVPRSITDALIFPCELNAASKTTTKEKQLPEANQIRFIKESKVIGSMKKKGKIIVAYASSITPINYPQ